MLWLSQAGEAFAAEVARAGDGLDVLVVGSGYGGAVAALRFAQANRCVTVLERGEEYVSGEFPDDFGQLGGHLRAEVTSGAGVAAMGPDAALFDLRIGHQAAALVGNGLGGGSLINAGVGLRADAQVLTDPRWPAAIRAGRLDRHYERAERELELQVPGDGTVAGRAIRNSRKFRTLNEIAAAAQAEGRVEARLRPIPIAVELRDQPPQDLGRRAPCTGCGECVTGCNHHAKLSLTATYLPRARAAGARFFTGITVLAVRHDPRPMPRGQPDPHPWRVAFLRTSERKTADAADAPAAAARMFEAEVRAATVILSAGTFGSTEILLRSRQRGLAVSATALGERVSGNGDDLSFAYDLQQPARAVAGSTALPPVFIGPTISGAVEFGPADDAHQRTLLQDGAVPGLAARVFHELATTLATAAQLGSKAFRHRGGDPLVLQPEALARSMVLLGMGHDAAQGTIAFDARSNRVRWSWPDGHAEATARRHSDRQQVVDRLGAIYLRNPAVNVLPAGVASVLSGPQPGGAMLTVHPLGGCPMGDDPHTAVVTDWGGVWRADAPGVFPGLYVLDGSIVPTSLGVNPMLTIAALAERACERILQASVATPMPCGHRDPIDRLPLPPARPARMSVPVETVLAEVLRGPARWPAAGSAPGAAALFVRLQVPDWDAVLQDPDHRVEVLPGDCAAYDASRFVLEAAGRRLGLRVVSGHALLFRQARLPWWQRWGRFLRLGLTYLIGRWLPDARRSAGQRVDVRGGLRLLGHANEVREFVYELALQEPVTEQTYRLLACKRIDAAASCRDLRQWWRERRAGHWPPVRRDSVWQQLSEADFTLFDAGGRSVATGRLRMDLPDILRYLPSQLGQGADTLNALLGLAAYPLFMLRVLVKTRLLDFRLPDYRRRPLPAREPALLPQPPDRFELFDPRVRIPPLRLAGGRVAPQVVALEVPLSDRQRGERIRIGLIRYRPKGELEQRRSERWPERTRVKSILLINGFAQNTRAFVAPELGDRALASTLYAQGWDVWLLEYRVSPLLRASARFSSMDDIAAFDIPAAVEYVRRQVEQDCRLECGTSQIFALGHCVGAASLAMSVLGGQLARWEQDRPVPHLAGVLFSQFHPFVIGSETAQQRLQVGSLLRNVLQLDLLQFTAGAVQADLLHAMLDRLLSSAAAGSHVPCPHEQDLRVHQPDTTTCRRMSGILSPLFSHDALHPKTHGRLDWYFGRTNLGVFLHGARCVEQERLVSENGQNVYATDKKIGRYLTMPVMLLHGADNALFHRESMLRTAAQLQRSMGGAPSKPGPPLIRSLGVAGFAHFDCTVGRAAPERIFDPLAQFFGEAFSGAWGSAPAVVPLQMRCIGRVPLTGPLIGWVRRGADGGWLLRVWFEVDLSNADRAIRGVTRVTWRDGNGAETPAVQAWPLRFSARLREPREGGGPAQPPGRRDRAWLREVQIGYCLADVPVPAAARGPVTVEVLSLHRFMGPAADPGHAVSMALLGLPDHWGIPVDPERVQEEVRTNRWPSAAEDFRDQAVAPPATEGPGGAGTPGAAAGAAAAGEPQRPVIPPADVPLTITLDLPLGPGAAEAFVRPAPAQPGPDRRLFPSVPVQVEPKEELSVDAFKALLAGVEGLEGATDAVARGVRPDTLSRARRRLSRLGDLALTWTLPPDAGLRFLAAACRHPGLTLVERDRADASLHAAAGAASGARFMALLGDQIYADARAGLFDTDSEIERVVPRYRQAFGSRGFRTLASRLPLHMILDDHEIHDNWSVEELRLRAGRQRARNALVAYDVFQRQHGPATPGNRTADSYFVHDGVAFFALDTRSGRRRTGAGARLLRQRQRTQLLAALQQAQQTHPDRTKWILCGSVLAPGLVYGEGENPPRDVDTWQQHAADRIWLLELIAALGIRNAVLLSSDYHCSAVATIRLPGGIRVLAICAPPLHAPMAFANGAPGQLLAVEHLHLGAGRQATVVCDFMRPGEGWLDCCIEPGATGDVLHLDFHLRDMTGPQPDTYQACPRLTYRL
jgi:cholesterol oxidase